MTLKAIRALDILISFVSLILLSPVLALVFLFGLVDTGSPLFIQPRLGRNKKIFKLIKFRTMALGTKSVASHLASGASITQFGSFLRKTKIDELPQLFNVLKGDMSIVGPRPNLVDQYELIRKRDALGIYDFLPGITGLAQVNKVDMSTPKLLARVDKEMLDDFSIKSYWVWFF